MPKTINNPPILLVIINEDWFFCSNYLTFFQKILKAGYTIYIAANESGYQQQIEAAGFHFINIAVKRKSKNIFVNLQLFFRLIKLYRQLQPGIIHHITLKMIMAGTLAGAFYKQSKIVNHFAGLGHVFTLPPTNLWRRFISINLRAILSLKKSKLFFENEDDRNDLIRVTRNSLRQTAVINSGIDLAFFSYALPPANNMVQILFPARMIVTKGVWEFIEMAKLCRDKWKGKVQFILAGSIDFDNPAYIKEEDIKKNMEPGFLEWIGFEENIRLLLQQSNIVVLPSYREGLPKSLMEAAAVGRPIITTDVPGCRECVMDGCNGFLVPVKNAAALALAVEKLIADIDLQIAMGKNSRALAEKEFDIQKVVEKTLEIYAKLLS